METYTEDVLNKVYSNFILNNTIIGKTSFGYIGIVPINLLGSGLSVIMQTTEEIDTDEFLDNIDVQSMFMDEAFSRFRTLFESEITDIYNIRKMEIYNITCLCFDVLFEEDFIQTMDEFIEHVKRYSPESSNKEFVEFLEKNREECFSVSLFLEENDLIQKPLLY